MTQAPLALQTKPRRSVQQWGDAIQEGDLEDRSMTQDSEPHRHRLPAIARQVMIGRGFVLA